MAWIDDPDIAELRNGPPSDPLNPPTPEDADKNEAWKKSIGQRLGAAVQTAQQQIDEAAKAVADSPTGDPDLDRTYNGMREFMPPLFRTNSPNTPPPPPPELLASVRSVEDEPLSVEKITRALDGVEPLKQSALLRVYAEGKKVSAADAYRNMLLAKNVLNGDVTAGQWIMLENEAFGEHNDQAPRGGPVFQELNNLSGGQIQPLPGENDPLRISLLRAYVSQLGPQDQELLLNTYSHARLVGGLSASEAFGEFKQGMSELYGNARAVGPLALSAADAAKTFGPSLIIGALTGGTGLLARAGGAAVMTGLQLTAEEVDKNLPEGTPDAVRTGISFGLYGLAGGGGAAAKARTVAELAIAGGGGQAAAEAVGAPGLAGAIVAPILVPKLAARLARQLMVVQAEAPAAKEAIGKLGKDLTRDDIGTPIFFGESEGVVAGIAGQTREGVKLLNIQLSDGRSLLARADEVAVVPGAGTGATLASEAERLRTGSPVPVGQEPMVMTPEALDGLNVGRTRVHFTPAENAEAILKDGFKPTPAGPDTPPGVYVTKEPTGQQAQWYGGKFSAGRGGAALAVEVPVGKVATEEEATNLMRDNGWRYGAEDMQKLTTELQRRGFVGTAWRDGEVFFDAGAVKAKVASTSTSWEDLLEVAKGVMSGKTRLLSLKPVGGGGLNASEFPVAIQQAVDMMTSNETSRRLILQGASESAQNNIPSNFRRVRAALMLSPGMAKRVMGAVLGASRFEAAQSIDDANKALTMQKVLKEAFGNEQGGKPLLGKYTGPDARLTSTHKDEIGTLFDAMHHPDEYALTPKQVQGLELVDEAFNARALLLQERGFKFAQILSAYAPHKRALEDPSFFAHLFGEEGGAISGGAGPSRGFMKGRKMADNRDWADFLATDGEAPEHDLTALFAQRLRVSTKLMGDRMFLQGVVDSYGKRLIPSGDALREGIIKLRGQLRSKLSTAIRQEVRGKTQRQSQDRFNRLLEETEDALKEVDEDLFKAKSPGTTPGSTTFYRLEGALRALDREADKVAGFTQTAQETATATEARLPLTKDAIIQMKANLRSMQQHLAGPGVPHGWVEVGQFGGLPHRYIIPEDVANEVRGLQTKTKLGPVATAGENLIDLTRNQLLSADFSAYTRQGLSLAEVDLPNFLSKFVEITAASTTPDAFISYLAHRLPQSTFWAQAGLQLGVDANDAIRGAGGTIVKGRVPSWVPIIGQVQSFNEMSFGRTLPLLKMHQANSMLQMLTNIRDDKTLFTWATKNIPLLNVGGKANDLLKNLAGVRGMDNFQLAKKTADVINNVGGGIEWAKVDPNRNPYVSLLTKMTLLTEGWLRANMGNIITPFKLGDASGVLARRFMFQQLAYTTMLSTAISMAVSGRMPNLDPTATDFLDVKIGASDDPSGAGSLSILPGKTYIRTIMREILGTPDNQTHTQDQSWQTRLEQLARFGEGRRGQLLGIGADLTTGKDYLGRPIDNRILYAAKNLLPIAAQAAISGEGPAAIAAQVGGLNWVPQSPFDARNRKVKELGLKDQITGQLIDDFTGLSEVQRAKFEEDYPEYGQAVLRYQEDRASPFAEATHIRQQHGAAVGVLGKAFRGEAISEEELSLMGEAAVRNPGILKNLQNTPKLYRNMLADLTVKYREMTDLVLRDKAEQTATSEQQQVVRGFYAEVVDASIIGGTLDYDLMDRNERSYRSKVMAQYGQKGLDVLDQELQYRVSDDAVASAYHRDQEVVSPYFENMDSYWNASALQAFGFDKASARSATENYPNQVAYQAHLTSYYIEKLAGKPLPYNIGNMTVGGETLYQHYGIIPGKRLNDEQARVVAERVVGVTFSKYNQAIDNESLNYLKAHPATTCALKYWGYEMPVAADYLLVTCPTRFQ